MRVPYDGCPLCGERAHIEVVVADASIHPLWVEGLPSVMRWLECEECGHYYVDGYLKEYEQKLLFSKSLEHQIPDSAIATSDRLQRGRAVAARLIDKVIPLFPFKACRWLDIGFGDCFLMTTAEEYGYTIDGIDVRESNVLKAKKLGLSTHWCDVENGELPEKRYGIIFMLDILEHTVFPRKVLKKVRDHIVDDGLLVLSMPNTDSFLWRQLSEKFGNHYWSEIEHLHNFSRRGLYNLLKEEGFEVERYGISERYLAGMEVIARKL